MTVAGFVKYLILRLEKFWATIQVGKALSILSAKYNRYKYHDNYSLGRMGKFLLISKFSGLTVKVLSLKYLEITPGIVCKSAKNIILLKHEIYPLQMFRLYSCVLDSGEALTLG